VKFVDKVSSKRFWRKLLPLVFPIAFEQLMYSFVSASDALMLGLLDQASLSAVSLAAQVQFVL
jgi:Na+-driven multidrug efflux pump